MKMRFKAVELKCLDEETIAKIREWRNQPFVQQMMYSQKEISEEEHKKYIAALLEDTNRGLFVFYLDDEPFAVYQYTIHPEGNYVVDGIYLIAEEYQYMGYGVLLIYFVDEIKFHYLHCHKSYGEVIDINTRVIALNEKMGILREGVLRQQALVGNSYHDVWCYGMLASEWDEKKIKIEKLVFRLVEQEYTVLM